MKNIMMKSRIAFVIKIGAEAALLSFPSLFPFLFLGGHHVYGFVCICPHNGSDVAGKVGDLSVLLEKCLVLRMSGYT